MDHEALRPRARFTAMNEITVEDADILGAEFVRFASDLPDRVLEHLQLLVHGHGGFPVDRLTHSLQTAMLAHDDGRDEEYVVCALLHDIGDTLGSYNHPEIAAAILRPFVSPENHWMVDKHGIFQVFHMMQARDDERDIRASLRRHPFYSYAEEFSLKYDCPAFDPARATPSLAVFEPMVRSVFARPLAKRAPQVRVVAASGG